MAFTVDHLLHLGINEVVCETGGLYMETPVARRKRSNLRAEAGVYMIELLMAIAISAMLSATLVGSMADTERLSTAGPEPVNDFETTLNGN